MKKAIWMSILLIMSLAPPVLPKRGGGFSMGRSSGGRGSSAARTSSGGGMFGGSRSSSSGGGFGMSHGTGQKTGGGWSGSGGQRTSHNTGWGHTGGSSSNWNPKHSAGSGGWGRGHTSTRSGLGGLFNTQPRHRYSKGNGIGSVFRSNSFKNAIVGAAAGYLTYQAGKAIIRSVAHPMMWGGRSYYWGSNYYQPRHGQTNMCRMPIDSSDQQFGNVYFQDNTRPREIVWGCGYYEYCCGYECCRGGSASGYGLPAGIGGILFAGFVLCCFLPMALKYFQLARMVRVW